MLELFEFKLPFQTPFRTGSSVFESREGIVLRYTQDEFDILAEASPLPGFSKESLADVRKILKERRSEISGFLDSDFKLKDVRNFGQNNELDLPSIQFALSYMGLKLLANMNETSIHDFFGKKEPKKIKVNDVIGSGSREEMESQILNSIRKGFKVIKIKVPHPVDDLANLLLNIHKKYPEIRFRLDANQSWPTSTLQKNCEQFKKLPIQYIEEPCELKEINELALLQQKCSNPIALDESISDFNTLKKALKNYPDLYVIIKPMLLGNILEIHETISQIRSSSKHIVCTTTLESRIGRSIVASTASIIGDPNLGHGLNTGHLFATDLLPDFKIENGSLFYHQINTGIESYQNIKSSLIKKLV